MNTTNPEMMTDNQLRTECERLMEENTKLRNEITQSMKILREANCEILGDVKDGVTKDQLKAQIKELKKQIDQLLLKETKTHNENVALKSATRALAQEKIDELEVKVYDLKKAYDELVKDYEDTIYKSTQKETILEMENDRLEGELDAYKNTETDDIQTIKELKKELEEIKEVKKIVTEVATQTETDGLQEEIDKLKKNNEDGCKLIKALMDKLHPLTARVLGVAQYLVEHEDNRIERSTICDHLGFTPEFLKEFEDNGGKVAKDLGEVMAKYVVDEVKEEEEEDEGRPPANAGSNWEEWWQTVGGYDSFEEAIVGEFGDQSEQAKKFGFGVFKKE